MHEYRNEAWLREQYVDRGRSLNLIAADCGTTAAAILAWCRRFGIARRPADGSLCTGEKHHGWGGEDIILTCALPSCGKTFARRPYQMQAAEKRGHHESYCCPAHANADKSRKYSGENSHRYNGGLQTAPCAWCGKQVSGLSLWQIATSERHFCRQRDCRARWQSANRAGENHPRYKGGKVPAACSCCGATRMVYLSRRQRLRENYVCANCLRGENHYQWKGEDAVYHARAHWYAREGGKRWVRHVWQREDRACALCGRPVRFELSSSSNWSGAHHLLSFSLGVFRSAPINGLLLCGECHRGVHCGPRWYAALLLESIRWEEPKDREAFMDALAEAVGSGEYYDCLRLPGRPPASAS